MKTKLILGAVLLTAIALAQPPQKSKGQEKKEEKQEEKQHKISDLNKEQEERGNSKKENKNNPGQDKKDNPGASNGKGDKGNASGHSKDHPGQGHAYGKNKEGLTGREFGQQRAAEARAKHEQTKPTSKEEIRDVIVVIQERNTSLLSEIERKVKEAREKLEEMMKGGTIKLADFQEKINTLEEISKKRATIELKLQ